MSDAENTLSLFGEEESIEPGVKDAPSGSAVEETPAASPKKRGGRKAKSKTEGKSVEAALEPPSGAALEPPTGAVLEPPSGAALEPPNEAALEPPTGAVLEPPTGAVLEPPTEAVLELSVEAKPAVSLPDAKAVAVSGATVAPIFEEPGWVDSAMPVLEDPARVRERAIEVLRRVDPELVDSVPPKLPFPPEDDPLTRTADEWEAIWYATRESAKRVYWNVRVEFRRHLSRRAMGEESDAKPWTYWAYNGGRPQEGESVYGLTEERRRQLGWTYAGSVDDFRIYREARTVDPPRS